MQHPQLPDSRGKKTAEKTARVAKSKDSCIAGAFDRQSLRSVGGVKLTGREVRRGRTDAGRN
jgi:hypothetical protein